MRTTLLFCFALVAASGAANELTGTLRRELMDQAKENWDSLPAQLQNNFTIENLLEYATVTTVSVTDPDGVETVLPASNEANISPADIWQIGKELWQMIADNTPVSNISVDYAGAVPKGVDDWTTMQGWQDYNSDTYTIQFKNFLGMLLTQYKWSWGFKHSGMYGGVGKYVTQAGPITQKAYAMLSEHLDVSSSALDPVNYGTTEQPIAGLTLSVTVKSHGYFKSTTAVCTVIVRGDGQMQKVSCEQN